MKMHETMHGKKIYSVSLSNIDERFVTISIMQNKPWYLYLIECEDGSIYTGITVDVAARYRAHQCGKGAKYTRSHPPKQLLKVLAFSNRSEASIAEYATKQLSATEKWTLVSSPVEHFGTMSI